MGVESMRKRVSDSLSRCYRSASRHPLLMFMVFTLFWTYRSFPVLFTLLVHASPVIASTLVLLGTLLFYGHANAPEVQKEGRSHQHDVHNLVFGGVGSTEIDEEAYRVDNMNVGDDHTRRSSIDSCVSRGSKRLTLEGKSELGNRKPLLVNRGGHFQHFGSGNSRVRSSDGSRRNSFDPLHNVDDDDNKGWDTGSDVVEGSSPSGSMADMFPMLDEFNPLLESDGHLEQGEIVHETDEDVDDDDDDHDHEDMEVRDDDEEENVMTWTEDDHRSHMNMGTLELERNQRLESLVARQKAIKNMRILAEKNMVNMSPFIDTHISTDRNTPFDLSNHSNENILESAPHSDMMPRRNPFDLSYDPRGGKPDHLGPTFQSESVAFQTNNPKGGRRESSDFGHLTLRTHAVSERIASDTESIGLTSDINEHIIPRSRFPEDDNTVNPQQAAEGDNRSNEVEINHQNTGYEDKTSNKSSSSSFFDVTGGINDGGDDNDNDNDNEEVEYTSIDNSTSDSEDLEDSEESENDEGGLPQRLSQGLKSWFTGWRA